MVPYPQKGINQNLFVVMVQYQPPYFQKLVSEFGVSFGIGTRNPAGTPVDLWWKAFHPSQKPKKEV